MTLVVYEHFFMKHELVQCLRSLDHIPVTRGKCLYHNLTSNDNRNIASSENLDMNSKLYSRNSSLALCNMMHILARVNAHRVWIGSKMSKVLSTPHCYCSARVIALKCTKSTKCIFRTAKFTSFCLPCSLFYFIRNICSLKHHLHSYVKKRWSVTMLKEKQVGIIMKLQIRVGRRMLKKNYDNFRLNFAKV